MVCRLVQIKERACYCVISDWHTYVDDECSVMQQWMVLVWLVKGCVLEILWKYTYDGIWYIY